MIFHVEWASSALRDLNRLPPKVADVVVTFCDVISTDPGRIGKPLRRDYSGVYTAVRGAYRVLYKIHDDRHAILIVRIAHRADVYRRR